MRGQAMKAIFQVAVILGILGLCGGCSPKVGSEAWCKAMNNKPKGQWTVDEASEYTKHCLFK